MLTTQRRGGSLRLMRPRCRDAARGQALEEGFGCAIGPRSGLPGTSGQAADHAPASLYFDAASALIRRQINDRTSALKRDVEALNWTEPGAPLRPPKR